MKHEIPVSDDFWEQCVTEHSLERPPNSQTVQQFADKTGRSKPTARTVLEKLVKEGKLERRAVGREIYYYPSSGNQTSPR